jgi:excisionase family DNA binding protein
MSTNTLLSISEAARRKGVSRQTISKYIAQGRLRSRLVLGRPAVREGELMALRIGESKGGRPAGQALSSRHKTSISEAQKKRWQKVKAARKSTL